MNEINVFEEIKSLVLLLHKQSRLNHSRKGCEGQMRYGRAPGLSNFFEEKFAETLAKLFPDYNVYIDYPMRVFDSSGHSLQSQNIYPDILLTSKDDVLKAIIELKLDIGRLNLEAEINRKVYSLVKSGGFGKVNPHVNEQKGLIERKKNPSKPPIEISFPKDFKKIMIIVTSQNQHTADKRGKLAVLTERLEKRGFETLTLLNEVHYNCKDNINDQIINDISKQRDEIERIFEEIK